jgi:hypothetical protein
MAVHGYEFAGDCSECAQQGTATNDVPFLLLCGRAATDSLLEDSAIISNNTEPPSGRQPYSCRNELLHNLFISVRVHRHYFNTRSLPGVWWRHFGGYVETVGSMTLQFHQVPSSEERSMNEWTSEWMNVLYCIVLYCIVFIHIPQIQIQATPQDMEQVKQSI